jgi:hypothetical protein
MIKNKNEVRVEWIFFTIIFMVGFTDFETLFFSYILYLNPDNFFVLE